MKFETELKVAIEAVEKACRLCKDVQSSLVSEETMTKKDKSPVTVADFGAQALICRAINEAFPDDPIVAEEDTAELNSEGGETLKAHIMTHVSAILPGITESEVIEAIDSGASQGGAQGRLWTLDPIDGTKGFLRGEQYAVALALIENGEVVLGIVGCPDLPLDLNDPGSATGCLLWGIKGEGAHIRTLAKSSSTQINVSEIQDSKDASFCESVESAHSSHGDAQKIADLLGVTNPPIRIDSQCKYAVIARGDASIYLRLPTRKDYVEKIWDHASGALIVTEAGGTVTDIHGRKLDFSLGRTLLSNKGIVASNGKFHDKVISAIGEVLGDED
jgi:3'(2'), 5'-bisphosphate nucleotidase